MVIDSEMRYKKILQCIEKDREQFGGIKEMTLTYDRVKQKIESILKL
jgi:hypothetical protein